MFIWFRGFFSFVQELEIIVEEKWRQPTSVVDMRGSFLDFLVKHGLESFCFDFLCSRILVIALAEAKLNKVDYSKRHYVQADSELSDVVRLNR